MILDVHTDIPYTIPIIPDIPDTIPIIPDFPEISPIPKISIIIQIIWRLWFQNGITFYVCSDIPNIPDIPDIPEITTVLEITILIQITSTFLTFPTFLIFRNSHYSWSYFLDLLPCKIWRS